MTNERTLRDALRADAERDPVPADGWRRVTSAIQADARRRRNRRLAGGVGAAVLAAAAAIGVGLVVADDEQATVEVQGGDTTIVDPGPTAPPTSVTAVATTAPPPSTPPTVTATATTAPPAPAPTTPATSEAVPSTEPEQPGVAVVANPVVAVTADGRVVTLDPATGAEVGTIATTALPDPESGARGGTAVAVAGGVVYYSEPFEETGRIMRVPIGGGEPEFVARGAFPAVSPDHATLAFVRINAVGLSDEVVLFDLATGSERSATTWAPDDPDFFNLNSDLGRLAWSPDGTRLAIEASYEGSWTFVFEPGVDATLTDGEPVASGLISPTWAGPDLVEGVWSCCYPFETPDPGSVRVYRLGEEEPVSVEGREVVFVDRQSADRAVEIMNVDPNGPWPYTGPLVLRGGSGEAVWETTTEFIVAAA